MRVRVVFGLLILAASPLSAKTTIAADADSYVNNSSPVTALGTGTTLVANSNNGVRIAYLRFNLSGISKPFKRITLDLTSSGIGLDSYHVFGLTSGENWQESTLNWNNAPGLKTTYTTTSGTLSQIIDPTALYASGTSLATFGAPGASDSHNRVFDVTRGPLLDFVNADADQIVTFVIVERDPADSSGLIWHSKEATNSSFRPKMTIYHDEDTWENIRVILIGGQSNGDGRAEGFELPADLQVPQDNIPFYFHLDNGPTNSDMSLGNLTTLRPGATRTPVGGFGPEITLGRTLAPRIEQSPGNRLAIIKFASGGTNLHTQWKGTGDSSSANDGTVYQTWQRVFRNGISRLGSRDPDSRLDFAAMAWIQGESDASSGQTQAAYTTNLQTFIQDVRETVRPNLPFLIARLSENQTALSSPSDPNYQGYLAVRAAQDHVAATTPGAYLIDCDGPSFPMRSDFLHYAGGGLQEMGNRFANKLSELIILRQSIRKANGGGFLLEWNSVPGRKYDVDASPDLKTWTHIPAGAVSEWTDPSVQEKRFYRVAEAD